MEQFSHFFSFGGALSLVFMAIFLAVYLVPTIVSTNRRLKQTASIFVLNFFLGWTLIGWVIALMLALWPWADAPAKDDVSDLPNLYIPSGNDNPKP